MKKVLLFFILINLSLFAQSYINSLYDAIKENNPKKIIDIVNNYKIDLNNVFYVPQDVYFDGGGGYGTLANISPLIYAIECKNIEAIDTLLKLGANVGQLTDIYNEEDFIILDDYTNRISITPLMYAAYSSTEEVISFLIKKGAKVNVKDRKGRTALMYVARSYYGQDSSKELVDLLIKNKANVNAKDNDGRTALMYACWYASDVYQEYGEALEPDVVKSLIRAGANINEVDNYGNTALLHAIYMYSHSASDSFYWGEDEITTTGTLPIFETIRFLIYNGANVNIKNKDGETPLSLAEGLPQLTKLLINNGAY